MRGERSFWVQSSSFSLLLHEGSNLKVELRTGETADSRGSLLSDKSRVLCRLNCLLQKSGSDRFKVKRRFGGD